MSVRVTCDDMEAFGLVMFGGLPLESLTFRFGAMAKNRIDALENDVLNVPASFSEWSVSGRCWQWFQFFLCCIMDALWFVFLHVS